MKSKKFFIIFLALLSVAPSIQSKWWDSPFVYYPIINFSSWFLSVGAANLIGYHYGYRNGITNGVPNENDVEYKKFLKQKRENKTAAYVGAVGLPLGIYLAYKNSQAPGGIYTIKPGRLLGSPFSIIVSTLVIPTALLLVANEAVLSHEVRKSGGANDFTNKICAYFGITTITLALLSLAHYKG